MWRHILIRADRPALPAPAERDLGRRRAQERVQALVLVEHLRARNRLPERARRIRRRGHDRAPGVDDGVEVRDRVLAADGDGRVANLPETHVRVRDVVELDRAGEELRVPAADEELAIYFL